LPKCRTVNEQNRAARERQDRNAWQQNPEHPLSESRVSRRRYLVVTLYGHAGHDRRENRIERLVTLRKPLAVPITAL
jgi:trehalose utilization protein